MALRSFSIALLALCFFGAPASAKSISVMAPLVIGDPADPSSAKGKPEWALFKKHLAEMKSLGVDAVTVDVWWGLVEPKPGVYEWKYYHAIADAIEGAGLRWVPILSTHQCGHNVGDECNVPIPKWLWEKKFGPYVGKDLQYESEYGKTSPEVISVWGTEWAIGEYRRLFEAFQKEFGTHAKHFAEINVSLGTSGELRYPSYNHHDGEVAGYPTRGAVQGYAPIAIASFRVWLQKKYQTIEALNKAWTAEYAEWKDVTPPRKWGDRDGKDGLLEKGILKTATGQDFFAWYQDSLIAHGRLLLELAENVFHGRSAPFRRVEIGAKIPGIHWRVGGDRLAELSAGMIRADEHAWSSDKLGRGYQPLISAFRSPSGATAPRVLHFSCLEKSDGDGKPEVKSLAKSLVGWVGDEAKRVSVPLKGENALSWSLPEKGAWDNLDDALEGDRYQGLTILRMADVASDKGIAHERFKKMLKTHASKKD